jgi:hypothetical protein
MPADLAIELREFLHLGKRDELGWLVRRLAGVIAAECENAVEETASVLVAMRRGEVIENPSQAELKLLDHIEDLMAEPGAVAIARVADRCIKKPKRRGGRRALLTPEEQRLKTIRAVLVPAGRGVTIVKFIRLDGA